MHILEMSLHLIQLILQMLTKKNIYIDRSQPPVHHYQSIVFSCALLVNETITTYT